MTPREELEMLRAQRARLAELEAKAAGGAMPVAPAQPPAEESSVFGDLLQGGKATLDRYALGLKGLLPESVQALGDRIDQSLGSGGLTTESAAQVPDSTAGKVGSIGTDIGLSLIPGNAALKAANVAKRGLQATRLAKIAVPTALGIDVAANAGVAAATNPEDRGSAAMMGAAGSLAGAGAGRVLGGVMRESVSPQAQKLIDADMYLTPGQALSGPQAGTIARLLRGTEDKISSIPFVGDVISNAQQKSVRSFNVNRINDAIKAVGASVKQGGLEGLAEADELVSRTYDDVLPFIRMDPTAADTAVTDALTKASQQPLFDVAHQNKFEQFIDRRIYPLITSGQPIDGATFKALDSELGELSRKYTASGIGNEPLGKAFGMLRDEWRTQVSGLTPTAKQVLENANKAYAKLLPLEQAGAKSPAGFFTPKQLADSLRSMHMQPDELAQAARQVLPNTIPDSGTAGRAALANMLHPAGLGAGAAATAGLAGFTAPALAAAGIAGLYTKPGLKMATQGIHPLVKALRGSPATYDPNNIEDIIRNLTGRTAAAGFQGGD